MYMKNLIASAPQYKQSYIHELRISYIESVEGLEEYIFAYLHRNRVKHEVYYNYDLQGEYLLIEFVSEHQFKIFATKLNQRFPYFEVL